MHSAVSDMSTQPSVTIALPAYNAATIIERCLSSLLAQDYPAEQIQIIVGDNGSTDGTPELIAERFPGVTIVSATEGRGSAYGRNAAFRAARGKYICSIDADCVADPSWVANLVRVLETSPKIVGCVGGTIRPYRTETMVERWKGSWVAQNPIDGGLRLKYAATPNAAFRREVFDKVGGFDTTQGFDDIDLGYRICDAGYEILYARDAVVRHPNPSTIRDLYRHHVKYGVFHINLHRVHPDKFEDPDTPQAKRRLLKSTVLQIGKGIAYHFPRTLFVGDQGQGTRLWPLLMAVRRYANYVGARRALREPLRGRTRTSVVVHTTASISSERVG